MKQPPAGDAEPLDRHLSQISTAWSALAQAHGGPADAVGAAQARILERYSPAVFRYLRAAVGDPEAADDLFQEFALRLVRGDFRRADPSRGRFRDFLKTALYHLVVDHQRRRRPQPPPGRAGGPEPAAPDPEPAESDRQFLDQWRAEVLHRAWAALERVERQTGQPVYTVLRLRTCHPEERSPQLAERLSAHLGKPVTAGWVRKRLWLAREKFTDLVLEEVAGSLEEPTPDQVEQELLDLGLLDYCREALARRWPTPGPPG